MFDLPNAKRVRREEILSRASSASRSPSPPPPESTFSSGYQRLGELLNLDSVIAQPTPAPPNTQPPPHQQETQNDEQEDAEEEQEQEFEFRLFSAPSKQNQTPPASGTTSQRQDEDRDVSTQKLRIRLRSPSPARGLGDGRFVNPFRGWDYYFSVPDAVLSRSGAGAKDVEQDPAWRVKRSQFEDVAVSGKDMFSWSKVPWPGCHLPWRVIHLKRHQTKLPRKSADPVPATYIMGPEDRVAKSRKKPGKKRRLQLRKRVESAEAAKETDAEKRNRKNRERKIKRRQKAREAKAAAAAAEGRELPADEMDDVSSQDGE